MTELNTVYAEEAELTNEGVGSDLERERREGLVVGSGSLFLSVGFGVGTLNSGNVGRSGHVVDNGVEHHLNALVAVGRTAGYGNHCVIDGSLTDHGLDLVNGDLLAAEVLLHEFLVELRNGFDELLVVLVGKLLHVLGDFLLRVICAVLVVIDLSLHCNKVNDTGEIALSADGQLNGNSRSYRPDAIQSRTEAQRRPLRREP